MDRIVKFEDFVNRGVKTEEQVVTPEVEKTNEEVQARIAFLESKKDEVISLVEEMIENEMLEEGFLDKLRGKSKPVEELLKKATPEFIKKLEEAEKAASDLGEKAVFDKEKIVKDAYDNKFRGSIQKIPYQGKVHFQYKDGLSMLNKLAAGTGSMTVGESKTEK